MRSYTSNRGRKLGLAGLLLAGSLLGAVPASAQTGGAPAPGYVPPTTPTTGPAGQATIGANGKAVAPANAPYQVQMAIRAGNKISTKPYRWGGGHRSFKSKGYDCSGAVSYVLHGAGFLAAPLPSGPLAGWGAPGVGSWITVYANSGHTYAVIAGLRFDTSAVGESLNQGSGPRWRASVRAPGGYTARHYAGF